MNRVETAAAAMISTQPRLVLTVAREPALCAAHDLAKIAFAAAGFAYLAYNAYHGSKSHHPDGSPGPRIADAELSSTELVLRRTTWRA